MINVDGTAVCVCGGLSVNDDELQVNVYAYNLTVDVCRAVSDAVYIAVCWHSARAHLLRQVCMHKMGMQHLHQVQLPVRLCTSLCEPLGTLTNRRPLTLPTRICDIRGRTQSWSLVIRWRRSIQQSPTTVAWHRHLHDYCSNRTRSTTACFCMLRRQNTSISQWCDAQTECYNHIQSTVAVYTVQLNSLVYVRHRVRTQLQRHLLLCQVYDRCAATVQSPPHAVYFSMADAPIGAAAQGQTGVGEAVIHVCHK
jgi:hypothetical protein